jgi:hypothetical protein
MWFTLLCAGAAGLAGHGRLGSRVAPPRALPRAALNTELAVDTAAPSVALVSPRGVRNTTLQGSAFRVLREDFGAEGSAADTSCWLLTCAHVVAPGCTLRVQFPGGRVVPASLIGRAGQDVDLALIRIDAADLPPAEWPPALRLRPTLARVGEPCLGLGYPGGVYGPALSLGVVCAHAPAFAPNASSALGPLPALALDGREAAVAPTYVVTDAALAGGMSGGPLLGADGAVLGVNVVRAPVHPVSTPRATRPRSDSHSHSHSHCMRAHAGISSPAYSRAPAAIAAGPPRAARPRQLCALVAARPRGDSRVAPAGGARRGGDAPVAGAALQRSDEHEDARRRRAQHGGRPQRL